MTALKTPLKIGIVGCGAVSEQFHLPAILARSDIRLTAAVDRNAERTELIVRKTGARAFATVAEALPHIDAAIVALPHPLHAAVSIELLDAGKHVLVEKPMAITSAECDAMIAASKREGASLTVGQMRRFCPAVVAAKTFLDLGIIGRARTFRILEGNIFDWPAASDYLLKQETAGGGVLMDTGAHTFDLLLWFFGEVVDLDYRDDSFGGVEADCEVRLKMAGGVEGYIELSRTRNLPTELILDGERGRMVMAYKPNQLTLEVNGRRLDTFSMASSDAACRDLSIWHFMIIRQLENWVQSLQGKAPALVPGEEGRKAVAFIEQCYRNRRPLILPWVKPASKIAV
jgi:predicted dehydrogenase